MKAAVLTVSDRCHAGSQQDESGRLLAEKLTSAGWNVAIREIVPDEQLEVARRLMHYADDMRVSLVVTTGGTGAGPRDVTPEATSMIMERPFPGIGEALRLESARHTRYAMLSRGIAGSRGRTLIINMPGHPKAIDELWGVLEPVLEHACRLLAGADDAHN